MPHPAGSHGTQIPDKERRGRDQGRQTRVGIRTLEEIAEHPGNGRHHGDIRRQGDPLAEHIPGDVFPAFRDCVDQSPVDHHRNSSFWS